MKGKGTTDAICMARQMQENFRVKGKKLYFGFVDLEKAFEVPREVISWAMRKLGIEEWLVSAVTSMSTGAKTVVRTVYGNSKSFEVKVGMHQGSACGVCSKGVGSNSLQCTSCQKWVHKKCSGIKGSMSKVAKLFICRGCLNPVTSAGHTSVGPVQSSS